MALQRWLGFAGARRVIVPFPEAPAELVPAAAVRMRRDFRQLLTCIEASALLHQLQRSTTSDGRVVAAVEDYAVARRLLAPIFNTIVADGVTTAIRETVEAVGEDEEVRIIASRARCRSSCCAVS